MQKYRTYWLSTTRHWYDVEAVSEKEAIKVATEAARQFDDGEENTLTEQFLANFDDRNDLSFAAIVTLG